MKMKPKTQKKRSLKVQSRSTSRRSKVSYSSGILPLEYARRSPSLRVSGSSQNKIKTEKAKSKAKVSQNQNIMKIIAARAISANKRIAAAAAAAAGAAIS